MIEIIDQMKQSCSKTVASGVATVAAVVQLWSGDLSAADANLPNVKGPSPVPSLDNESIRSAPETDLRMLHSQFRGKLAAEMLNLGKDWEAFSVKQKGASLENPDSAMKATEDALRRRTGSLLEILRPIGQELSKIGETDIPAYLHVTVSKGALLGLSPNRHDLLETAVESTGTNATVLLTNPRSLSPHTIRFAQDSLQFHVGTDPRLPGEFTDGAAVASEILDLQRETDPETTRGIRLVQITVTEEGKGREVTKAETAPPPVTPTPDNKR